jgi:hypothetical protein
MQKGKEVSERPVSAADWQPYCERALTEYAQAQQGPVMAIDVRSLLVFMKRHNYPEFESEMTGGKILNSFLSRFFGPTWDGVKYRSVNHKVGKSLHMGTENVLDIIRYKAMD